MKKVLLVLTIMMTVSIMSSCATGFNPYYDNTQGQFQIGEGMTKQQVMSIMGTPQASEFNRGVEEWHYCKTGFSVDKFVSFFFHNGLVVAKKTYNVSLVDTGGATGRCGLFIKRGNYSVPDLVIEIRNR